MQQKIILNSPEYACFHEAGHAEVALRVGARVLEMELFREQPRSYGRTQIKKTEDRHIEQRRLIALGGFAAEFLLYSAGRLVNEDGTSPTESEFIQYAYRNVALDFVAFWGTDNPTLLNKSQKEMDFEFMNYAVGQAKHYMKADAVERIADALLATEKLTEAEVTAAATLEP